MKQPKVAILILNWNGKKNTIECLNSLEKIYYKNYEIILVDNASEGDDIKAIKKKFPKIKIIQNKTNLGFAEGNNIGIKYALKKGTNYVLLLNNDTIVDKCFLSELVKVAESDQKIGIVGPKEYFYDKPDIIYAAGRHINILLYGDSQFGYNEKDNGQYDSIKELNSIEGSAMLIKKKVFEKIGLFDKRFFAYSEDEDLCFRTSNAGYKILYVPKAKIWHKVSSSLGTKNPVYLYYITRNKYLFLNKNRKWYQKPFIIYDFLSLIKLIIHLTLNKQYADRNIRIKAVKDFLKGKFGKANFQI